MTNLLFQVADFGLSKIKRNTLVSGGVRGTLPWMAPELLNGSSNKVSEKVMYMSHCLIKCTTRKLTRFCLLFQLPFGIIEVCYDMGISQLIVFNLTVKSENILSTHEICMVDSLSTI